MLQINLLSFRAWQLRIMQSRFHDNTLL